MNTTERHDEALTRRVGRQSAMVAAVADYDLAPRRPVAIGAPSDEDVAASSSADWRPAATFMRNFQNRALLREHLRCTLPSIRCFPRLLSR